MIAPDALSSAPTSARYCKSIRQVCLQYACIVVGIAAAWVGGLIGCATPPGAPNLNLPAPFEDSGLHVTVEGFYMVGHSYAGVSGSARNVSGKDFGMCSIKFDVVDMSGAKVSDALAHTQGLKAGQDWRFQAVFTAPFATSFKGIQRGEITTLPTAQAQQAEMQAKLAEIQANAAEIVARAKATAGSPPKAAENVRLIGIMCEQALPGGGQLPRVTKLVADGLAARAGWQVGDLVLSIDGTEVRTLADVTALTKSGAPRKTYALQRGAETITSVLEFQQ